MNYGEELAFWYLRLNGFFPISNFVIHKSSEVEYSSDCDLLAIRPPYVYEEIGGKQDDWDTFLNERFDLNLTIGLICEVKTGGYKLKEIFRESNLIYSIRRLGFVPPRKIMSVAKELDSHAVLRISETYQIGKLLIANHFIDNKNSERLLFYSLDKVIEIIKNRIAKYQYEKYRDRIFFNSTLVQYFMDDIFKKKDAE